MFLKYFKYQCDIKINVCDNQKLNVEENSEELKKKVNKKMIRLH